MSRFFLPELPKEWAKDKLGNLVDIVYGEPLPAEKRNSSGVFPVYSSAGIIGTHNRSLYSESSIIIGRKGTVGSVFFTSKPFWCIDTAFYLRNIQKPINIKFLAALLKFIDLSNLKIVVGVPGVNRKDIENLTIPLPPLSEQYKIVEILREVDSLRLMREQSEKSVDRLFMSVLNKMLSSVSAKTKVLTLKEFSETRYGTSYPSTEANTNGIAILRIPNVVTGELDLSDLKYSSLNKQETQLLILKYGDILVVRTNGNPNYVGRSAHYEDDGTERAFASYLIRIRVNTHIAFPEYISDFLRSSKGRQLINSKLKTSAGQYNLNADSIASFPIPLLPLDIQQKYLKKRNEIMKTKQEIRDSKNGFDKLFNSISSISFSGKATENWRKETIKNLQKEIEKRDVLLRKASQQNRLISIQKAQEDPKTRYITTEKNWIIEQLSPKQKRILELTQNLETYFEPKILFDKLDETDNISLTDIEQTLELLSQNGLIKRVRIKTVNVIDGETTFFAPSFRILKQNDKSKDADLELIQQELFG